MSDDIKRNEESERFNQPPPSAPVNNMVNQQQQKQQDGGKFVHVSDVGTWKHADRSFWIFVALSIFTGFLGLDHFYIRSNETAIKKLLVNVLGFGFWYFYDVIQVLTEGKKIQSEGLSSPLDWIQGIGRGMFAQSKTSEEKGPKFSAPKSYMLYTILAVALGAFGADKFYLGYTFQGIVKFLSVFSIIFTIFGLVWVLYDAFNAIFMTDSLMKNGIWAPPPFSFVFRKPILAKELFEVQEEKEKVSKPFSIWDYIPLVGFFRAVGGFVPTVVEEVVQPLVGPSVCAVKKHAETAMELGKIGSSLVSNTLATAPELVNSVVNQVNAMTDIGQIQKLAQEHAQSQGLIPRPPQV